MKHLADAVTTVFTHDAAVIAFGVALDGVTYIPQRDARFDHLDANLHAVIGNLAKTCALDGGFADLKHAAGVAVVLVFNHGDVDVDDIAVLENLAGWYAVADLMVYRGADGLGKAPVVERGGYRLLNVDDVIMAYQIELIGGNAWNHMRFDHLKDIGREATRYPHFVDFCC